ncbi:MAG: type III-A CRISPR-associated protein Cas10/Csm1 [Ignavibacteria bacterium]|jgi:CRISPR-associated protein Csm1|nr:type III-A CRISPR-associated protein Cas10/Csm1 [Ignavibacteria bacterium]MCU7504471.1 type III-A CRISPR-associated protein Cas10/Csm1 [Ignavibacteria bacterium]MCU7517950.1 type III-A CRISPR-associated protein Cas10/Csm1 [Ignavibacteria bacterium]
MPEREQLLKGALFHDIGKFYQRSRINNRYDSHSCFSAVFAEKMFHDPIIDFIVANHHKKELTKYSKRDVKRILAEIVCEADSLSSAERQSKNTIRTQQPLTPIFTEISFAEHLRNNSQSYFQPLCHLTPEDYKSPNKEYRKDIFNLGYSNKWKEFEDEILTQEEEIDFNTLLQIFKKFLWCIPSSSYKTIPDISLYEHSRLTAAIAVCIYDFLYDKAKDPKEIKNVENRQEARYLLIAADLTGIQSYIYNIGHKGAMRALKGRSFRLQQLMDSVAQSLLSTFSLPDSNLIYSSGGNFYILAPNTEKVKKSLEDLSLSIEKKFLQSFGLDVGIVFAFMELSGENFTTPAGKCSITAKWDSIKKVLEQNKMKKYSHQFEEDFFIPESLSGKIISCSSTGEAICSKDEVLSTEKEVSIGAHRFRECKSKKGKFYQVLSEKDVEDKTYISAEQFDSQLIGYKLKKDSTALIYSEGAQFNLLGIDRFDIFLNNDLKEKLSAQRAFLINNDNFMQILNGKFSKGWKFYGGSWALESSFDELAKKSFGIEYLAILRMDVDNLGEIFKSGFGNNATFSRIVQLSNMLDFFFSSYLNRIQDLYWEPAEGIKEQETAFPLKNLVEIVYAGGDDLFITGVWNIMPDLALWINDNFQNYTGLNSSFTLSAGIELFDAKYPLFKAARRTGEAVERAKGARKSMTGIEQRKNAISFFGDSFSWKDFKVISLLSKKLYKLITTGQDNEKLSRSILNLAQNIYTEYTVQYANPWGSWRWRAAYYLSRFSGRNKVFKKEIELIASKLFTGDNTEQEYSKILNTASKWAEFLTRNKEE